MQEFVSFMLGALVVGAIACRLAYVRGHRAGVREGLAAARRADKIWRNR